MKVSVVIPVYNAEKYIAQTIESALNQSLNDHEVIVINDGSTDGSEAEIAKYEDSITYIPQSNAGVSLARNAGILAAKGDYVAFLDQDDLFLPTKLKCMSAFLDQHQECCMVYSGVDRIDEHGELLPSKDVDIYEGDIFPLLVEKSHIAPSMVVCRRDVLLEVGMFSERFSSEGEDYDLFMRMARKGHCGFVPERLVQYRVHPTNTCKEKQGIAPYRYEEIINMHVDYLFDNYSDGRSIYKKRMTRICRDKALIAADQGDWSQVWFYIRKALGFSPWRLDLLKIFYRRR